MCSHYQLQKDRERYLRSFGCPPPPHPYVHDLWPGSTGVFLRRPREADSGDEAVLDRESLVGRFGLLPHWAKDEKLSRHTYNARSETVHEKPSFRNAWKRAQHCVIPADAIFEPDWRSGKAVATRIERADGAPLGIAGLWSSWRSPSGEQVHSYTMLTINADEHALMRNFHRPHDEKRMLVILAEGSYDDWLHASAEQSRAFLQPYPADRLTADAASAAAAGKADA